MDPISNIPNTQNMNLIDWDIDETLREISELPPLNSLLELDSFGSSTSFDNNTYCFEDIKSGSDSDIDETFRKLSELSPLESILEMDSFGSSTRIDNNVCCFENIESESDGSILNWESYWTNIYDHQEMPTKTELVSEVSDNRKKMGKVTSGRKRTVQLELEEIKKHFHLPITKAAKEMKVGLTVLKKQCREFNIMRWPHRKIKSLKALIHNVKEMGIEGEIEMLEEHKRIVEKSPDTELNQRTIKLRQKCFKDNYKKKKAAYYTLI